MSGTKFPVEDYAALPIGGNQVSITWLGPSTIAIVKKGAPVR